jgi:hypothetical protein
MPVALRLVTRPRLFHSLYPHRFSALTLFDDLPLSHDTTETAGRSCETGACQGGAGDGAIRRADAARRSFHSPDTVQPARRRPSDYLARARRWRNDLSEAIGDGPVKRFTEPAAFALLIAIDLVESHRNWFNLRHWLNRGRVVLLIAMGLFLAGVVAWQAIAIGLAVGALCIVSGTWRLLNPLSKLAAIAGLGIYVFL